MSDSPAQPTPRRDFLARVATTAAVVIASSAIAAPLAASDGPASRSGDPVPPDFDDSWTQRVRAAKHRAVFDSPSVGEGLALEHAAIFMDNYHEMFGTGDPDSVAVVVIRHDGIALATNDAIWEKYQLGKRTTTKDPVTGEEAKRNPFALIGAGDKHALISPGASFSTLLARGVILLACNRALMYLASQEAKARNQDVEKTRAEFRAGLLPGVTLQPSGIYAVTRAQEAGCAFVKST